jgi:hypothetical protein
MQLYFNHIWCYETSDLSPAWCMCHSNHFCCKRKLNSLRHSGQCQNLDSQHESEREREKKKRLRILSMEKTTVPYTSHWIRWEDYNERACTDTPLTCNYACTSKSKISCVCGQQPPTHRRLPIPRSIEQSLITSSISVFPPIPVLRLTWYQHTHTHTHVQSTVLHVAGNTDCS